MLTHAQIWNALDRLAARSGLSASGLAKRAGLDPTTFNKSKRITPDGRQRWQITDLGGPSDARLLPGGRVLIAERNANVVSERDTTGKVLWRQAIPGGAIAADRLPNGNTLVAENNAVREFDRHGNVVWKKEMTWAVEANRY